MKIEGCTAIVTGAIRAMRSSPAANSRITWRAEPGVVGQPPPGYAAILVSTNVNPQVTMLPRPVQSDVHWNHTSLSTLELPNW